MKHKKTFLNKINVNLYQRESESVKPFRWTV